MRAVLIERLFVQISSFFFRAILCTSAFSFLFFPNVGMRSGKISCFFLLFLFSSGLFAGQVKYHGSGRVGYQPAKILKCLDPTRSVTREILKPLDPTRDI